MTELNDTMARAPSDANRLLWSVLAVLTPFLALMVQAGLWPFLRPHVWCLFYPAVFVSFWIGGLRSGGLATIISIVLVSWFFDPPEHFIAVNPWHYFPAAVLFGTGILFGAFHARLTSLNRQAAKALEQAHAANDEITRLYESAGRQQERFELALRGADLGAWDWNIATGEVVFTPRWAEMRGFRPEEIRPHVDSWISGVHPDDWPRVQRVLTEYLQGVTPEYEVEHRAQTKSGRWIWVLDRGKVFARDERGRATRMVGTELDITERKRLDDELRLAEAKSSGILSISADAIIVVDDDYRITIFNEGAEKIFGYPKGEAIGASLDILIPERFRALHRQHVERFAAGGDSARRMGERGSPIFGLRKNGEEFPADAAISKLEVSGKRLLTVTIRDVSEERRHESAQEFLAEAGSILVSTLDYTDTLTKVAQLAVNSLADLCIVDIVDEHGEVRRLKVASRDPAQAWLCDLLVQIPLDRRRPHLVWSVLKTVQPLLVQHPSPEVIASFSQSEEHLRANRAMDIQSVMAVPLSAHGKLLGAIAFVSSTPSRVYGPLDLRLAEELALRAALSIENARLYRAAQRAIQARDDVLGIVAHDLRNPLSAIVMQAALLRSGGSESERCSPRPADTIERAAKRMNRLIQDLLDVTRMEAGQLFIELAGLSPVELVAQSVEAQKSLAAAAALELRVDVARELPEVWGDRDRLLQVFENLIGNAIKFAGSGGRITVGAEPSDGGVRFWVADTGAGITEDHLPHLFERFWQARQAQRRGAGLGLPIAKGIVEAHGGRIWVESTPGHGSTFFFTIPTAPRSG